MKKFLNNKFAAPIVGLIVGIIVGAIFYPSKTITKEEISTYEAKIEKLENERREILNSTVQLLNENSEEYKEYKKESELKISSLKTENTHLKQKTKETIIKIIKPDGTITEKSVKTSDTEVVSEIVTNIKQEFSEKVSSIEKKWKTVHTKRVTVLRDSYEKKLSEKQHIIDTYSKKEVTKINDKSLGLYIGYTSDDSIYINKSTTLFGPIYIDVYVSSPSDFSDPTVGGAIGIGF